MALTPSTSPAALLRDMARLAVSAGLVQGVAVLSLPCCSAGVTDLKPSPTSPSTLSGPDCSGPLPPFGWTSPWSNTRKTAWPERPGRMDFGRWPGFSWALRCWPWYSRLPARPWGRSTPSGFGFPWVSVPWGSAAWRRRCCRGTATFLPWPDSGRQAASSERPSALPVP